MMETLCAVSTVRRRTLRHLYIGSQPRLNEERIRDNSNKQASVERKIRTKEGDERRRAKE